MTMSNSALRAVAPGVWLAWNKGGITKADRSVLERTGDSVQLLVFREHAGLLAIEAFQAGGNQNGAGSQWHADDDNDDPLAIMWYRHCASILSSAPFANGRVLPQASGRIARRGRSVQKWAENCHLGCQRTGA